MSRRRLTIPSPVNSGPDPNVEFTDEQWAQLETALERSIPSELRTDLIDVTNRFLRHVVSETEAPSSKPAKARLDRITRAAKQLEDAILDSSASYEVNKYVNSLIEKHLSELRSPNDVYDLANIVISACSKANEEFALVKNAGPVPVDNWNGWIRCLTGLLVSNGIRATVRKDTDKTDQSSAFVHFIAELQKAIPKAHRRGQQSPQALAVAITKARAGFKTPTTGRL